MTKSIDEHELDLMIHVVKKYYEMGMTQEQIAKEEFVSKSTVSRLLKKSIDGGLVTFQFRYPIDQIKDLEREFRQLFHVDKVRIAPTFKEDFDTRMTDTCRMAASDLCNIIEP
ncbi:MAG: helix-turn-helix domain-containing protein, partial [Clostridiales Family XIII bacterium]|nr:helix-turn-helix domain-containing protein [Clostridiales Family XIII bacterium]